MDDPRLNAFVGLASRKVSETIVIEGELAVGRALAAGVQLDTVVLAEGRVVDFDAGAADVVVLRKAEIEALTGFPFHRGVLASTRRPSGSFDGSIFGRESSTVVVTAGLADPANVGGIIRTARALGVDAVITDSDPYTRKAIRASAGFVFSQAVWHVPEIEQALATIRGRARLVACTPSRDATALPDFVRPSHLALLLGSEGDGLPAEMIASCDDALRIPIAPDVDSLGVGAAAAIVLHALGLKRVT